MCVLEIDNQNKNVSLVYCSDFIELQFTELSYRGRYILLPAPPNRARIYFRTEKTFIHKLLSYSLVSTRIIINFNTKSEKTGYQHGNIIWL